VLPSQLRLRLRKRFGQVLELIVCSDSQDPSRDPIPHGHIQTMQDVCERKVPVGTCIPEVAEWGVPGTCSVVNGGANFYSGSGGSSNTGFEVSDEGRIYFVQGGDSVWLVVNYDDEDTTSGSQRMRAMGQGTNGVGLEYGDDASALLPDPTACDGVNSDCYAWNGEMGVFNNVFAGCCTDGVVLGPFPVDDDFKLNLAWTGSGIDRYRIGTGVEADPYANFNANFNPTVAGAGVLVESYPCDECTLAGSCGECVDTPGCGWCDMCHTCQSETNPDCGDMPLLLDDTDVDGDGVCDSLDNCPAIPNSDQGDCDADGEGDVCDTEYTVDVDVAKLEELDGMITERGRELSKSIHYVVIRVKRAQEIINDLKQELIDALAAGDLAKVCRRKKQIKCIAKRAGKYLLWFREAYELWDSSVCKLEKSMHTGLSYCFGADQPASNSTEWKDLSMKSRHQKALAPSAFAKRLPKPRQLAAAAHKKNTVAGTAPEVVKTTSEGEKSFTKLVKERMTRWSSERPWQAEINPKLQGYEFAAKLGLKHADVLHCGSLSSLPDFENMPRNFIIKPSNLYNAHGVVPIVGRTVCSRKQLFRESARDTIIKSGAFGASTSTTDKFIVESYIKNHDLYSQWQFQCDAPLDFKFYMFGDTVAAIAVRDRPMTGTPTWQFFDEEWNILDGECDFIARAPHASKIAGFAKPENLDEMIAGAKTVGSTLGMFVRVDMYSADVGTIFGEVTYWPANGLLTQCGNDYMTPFWQGLEGAGELPEKPEWFDETISVPGQSKLCPNL